ncbi:MAG: hypothetical protein JKY70_18270 [Mucilaginibacter sp.]|nr:hypothetical protein [Mucilaginibacter sp.]
MNLQLDMELLDYLKAQGYRYCLSKTTLSANDQVNIHLTPVKVRPYHRKLPKDYDTYFKISKEPTRLAKGVDGLKVIVSLDKATVKTYVEHTLQDVITTGSSLMIIRGDERELIK